MSTWKKIRSNLWRNQQSDRYYARMDFRHPTKHTVWRSLNTDSVETAKLRLPGKLAEIRAAAGRVVAGAMTLEDCAAVFRGHKVTRRGSKLADGSLKYRRECVDGLRKKLPLFAKKAVGRYTIEEMNAWAAAARAHYSPTRFNGQLQALRAMFASALDAKCCAEDPTRKVVRAAVKPKRRLTPARELFGQILLKLDERADRQWAQKSIRAFAFTGMRPKEAKFLVPADVDIQREQITARVTKNGKERVIPMIPQAKQLFEEDFDGTLAALKKDPRKALATVCRELGIKRLTRQDLRAMFSLRMDEAGVSIRTGASILGHQDAGQTRARHYLHTDNTSRFVRGEMQKVVV